MAERQDDQQIEFHRSGEWTAVYVGGQLVRAGEHYLADEWLRDRVGVIVVDESPFLLPDGRTARDTVAEVDAERERRSQLWKRAADLRARSLEMDREIKELERQARGGRLM